MRYHHWTALADPIADRRTDLYAPDLGWADPADAAKAHLREDVSLRQGRTAPARADVPRYESSATSGPVSSGA